MRSGAFGVFQTLFAERASSRGGVSPARSTKAIYSELVSFDMSRKLKVLLALVLVVAVYKLFIAGDTATVEYETED